MTEKYPSDPTLSMPNVLFWLNSSYSSLGPSCWPQPPPITLPYFPDVPTYWHRRRQHSPCLESSFRWTTGQAYIHETHHHGEVQPRTCSHPHKKTSSPFCHPFLCFAVFPPQSNIWGPLSSLGAGKRQSLVDRRNLVKSREVFSQTLSNSSYCVFKDRLSTESSSTSIRE